MDHKEIQSLAEFIFENSKKIEPDCQNYDKTKNHIIPC